jgi:hypothetical protein
MTDYQIPVYWQGRGAGEEQQCKVGLRGGSDAGTQFSLVGLFNLKTDCLDSTPTMQLMPSSLILPAHCMLAVPMYCTLAAE